MSNSSYWRERFKELEKTTYRSDMNFVKKLVDVFTEAAKELDYAIYKFFKRFSNMEHISLAEANKLLNSEELKAFHMTVDEYIKLGRHQNIEYSEETEKTLEEASLKYRVTRLEAVSYEMSAVIGKAMGSEKTLLFEYLGQKYQDRYYKSAFTVFKNYGVGVTFAQVNTKTLDKLLKTPWAADGFDFSTRIWNNQTKLVNTLRNVMSDACIRGSGYSETSEKLAKQMNTTLNNATRLVVTESAFFSSEAQKDCFNELGAEEYEIIATLDETTDEECQQLDGEIFPMKDFKAGETAPPFHVNCRCCTAPYFDDSDVPGYVEGTRAARNKGGKTYKVPRNMKYPEWKKKYVDNEVETPVEQSKINDRKGSLSIEVDHIDSSNNPKLKAYDGLEILDFTNKIPAILPKGNIITKKQFGEKIGKHAQDYDLNPSSEKSRNIGMTIINEIIENCEEVRYGYYRGQDGVCQFYRKGSDVVISNEKGHFVTLLEGGKNATRFKNARTTKSN